ncbi:MAG: hypothetical protein ACKOQ4_17185 [Mycobacterium sp.]
MRAVLVLAVAGVVALAVAALTGSTPLALVVIALAVAGIVQLMRDWRSERGRRPAGVAPPAVGTSAAGEAGLSPDQFSPDISTEPGGPSSDARADQV